jgi:hypothetical protein
VATRSEQINELAAALAKAQAEITAAEEDRTAKVQSDRANYTYGYATLASVWDACRGPLSKHGLSVVQTPVAQYGRASENERDRRTNESACVTVTTLLLHQSGQWIESVLTLNADGTTPQKIGSAITYARRYALSSMVGVAPDDDDGADASGVQTQFEPRRGDDVRPVTKPQQRGQQQTPKPPEEQAPPPPDFKAMAFTTLRDVCRCKTPENAMAVCKFVMGDGWEKLPGQCTQEEAKALCEGLTKCAEERVPLEHVLEKAMEPT